MLQVLALLAFSWLLLHYIEQKDLKALGFIPSPKQWRHAAVLFIFGAFCAAGIYGLRIYFAKEQYSLNQALNIGEMLREAWYVCRGVLTEELLFRGALLYILMRRMGNGKAILLSSVLFGLAHWLNGGAWSSGMQLILTFGFTFAMGLLLAYTFVRTQSILLPIALHLGWNLTEQLVFPGGNSGQYLFVKAGPPPEVTLSYPAFFTMLLLPKICVLAGGYYVVKHW